MNLRLPLAALVALAAAAPAGAAERNFSVTDFSRVRVDGPYRVQLTTGVAPFARASGTPAALDGVSVEVQGRTLIVRRNPSSWGGYPGESPGPVEISVGTHDLTNIWLNGAGALKVSAVKGQSLDLSLVGAGTVAVGGIQVDRLTIAMTGSGSAVLAGKAAQASAVVRGTGMLDASALTAKDAKVGAEGSTVVRLTATGTASVDSQGTATVELSGRPACTVKATGSAVVSGCR